jgi:hypothetical protein
MPYLVCFVLFGLCTCLGTCLSVEPPSDNWILVNNNNTTTTTITTNNNNNLSLSV